MGELEHLGWGSYTPFGDGLRAFLGEDFAILEVTYTVTRLLLEFPVLRLPEGEVAGAVANGRQRLTIVLSCAEWCRVEVEMGGNGGEGVTTTAKDKGAERWRRGAK